jgi:histidyl-tRNA synthetase
VDYSLTPAKPDKQFKRAQELNAAHTIKIERLAEGTLVSRIRNLKAREEKVVNVAEAINHLRLKRRSRAN